MTRLETSGQLNLPMDYFRELDRNFEKGGRSFYFFDFDDNVVHLYTKIIVFEKNTGRELEVSTQDFALVQKELGKSGSQWENYELLFNDFNGSFRNFREQPDAKTQPLVRDMEEALKNSFVEWRGPSWDFFVHAVYNNRPISIITARGHHPHTIRRAIDLLVQSRDLAVDPNYLSIYSVSHPETRRLLGDADFKLSTAELKKVAIQRAVQDAFACYGFSPHHRFGMSDDDPHNVALIAEAMRELKSQYPDNAFFVINTHERKIVKEEVLVEKTQAEAFTLEQLSLFSSHRYTDL